ncbi:Re/Si-specific NAD(P)(+) transhydrogenase subunit alpha [Cellulomonas sp. JH27-2]|uniref:Re/Si-specific NAD(P)(+) transhydrogenase subunit alpha n=1 Tax=Cellulomonas sp. JH27-2 TaxID=2774139 RepID=UPI00177EAE59|nr:Re/Si-specific NAD(P)(+) transhydrogenase subunit alpha [Cellulomonas sp. JH27-2]MBD8059624.1 Re/Si-specific NAD(P)(+) transhydrogenase subunit alpha [Cellulomonas sp. JH27-2]
MTTIGIPRETQPGERLVAGTPATVARLVKLGYDVVVEAGAGQGATYADDEYAAAGAVIVDAAAAWGADVVTAVHAPDDVSVLAEGATLVAMLAPAAHPEVVESLRERGGTAMALDAVPRISRAQSLDVLSTLSNVAGYRAVIEAAAAYGGMFGGQVTAAGKTAPATVFVIGAGVAGLAAIGAAGSLGAQVRAFDVRPEVGEQIESMGATFVQADDAQQQVSSDGYASALSEAQERASAAVYARESASADVVITTALVRGSAPTTITGEMVAAMRPGSVVVDLAASGGGNCEATVPGQTVVTDNGVTVVGWTDLPGRLPRHTSQLFGTNVVHLMQLLTPGKDGVLVLDLDDQVQRGMTVTHGRRTLWPPPPVAVSAAATSAPAGAGASSGGAVAGAASSGAPGDLADAVTEVIPAAPSPGAKAARPPKPPRPPLDPARAAQRRTMLYALGAVLVTLAIAFAPAAFLGHFTVFVLAVFVGYYVISHVTHSLHTPLMAQTNAISGIIVVGALLQIGSDDWLVTILACIAAALASINVFGGFLVANRMIRMFRKDA